MVLQPTTTPTGAQNASESHAVLLGNERLNLGPGSPMPSEYCESNGLP